MSRFMASAGAAALLSGIALLVACSGADPEATTPGSGAASGGRPTVATVNYPLAYFAERIAGDGIDVIFQAPADEDPAFWMPGADALAAYQGADLVLLNGATYAKWIDKVSLPTSRLVDTSAKLRDRLIEIEGDTTHSHGPEGEHAHGGFAFTTWLDPTLALEHARSILEAFAAKWPADKDAFENGFAALERDLVELDGTLKSIFAEDPGRPMVGSHPVYQYLARRYALTLTSVHWEPDEVPSTAAMAELTKMLADHPAKWMLWEGEPLEETATKLEALGIGIVVFNPCGNAPDEGDYLDGMRRNIESLERSYAP